MDVDDQITAYIDSQPTAKRSDLQTLHARIRERFPDHKLWFLDGRDATGKTVTNPNIGYGSHTLSYADGTTKPFYQIGLSANTTGISVYIMGLNDKTYLPRTYAPTLGKASVTGYCIKFKALKDIDLATLDAAIQHGVETTTNRNPQ